MNILWLDLDSLRPDHLGCYGAPRTTSPAIDRIAEEGLRFTQVYTSDAPCLPSRTAWIYGRFGIRTGAVDHGGSRAEPWPVGPERGFRGRETFFSKLKELGYTVASVSSFPDRHGAYWFTQGLSTWINPGGSGEERAETVAETALAWLSKAPTPWFLHLNFWDAHGPYRTPPEFGNPLEARYPDWYTEEIRQAHWASYGPLSAQDAQRYWFPANRGPLIPEQISSLREWERFLDGYDLGIRYADFWIGHILEALGETLKETAVVVTGDHGESFGELGVYADHQLADEATCHVPFLLRWPGLLPREVPGLLYTIDLAATILELAGGEVPSDWDGRSFAHALQEGGPVGREALVLSQMAWSCQRGVRFGPYLLLRTYHDGFKPLPPLLLFNIEEDPHEVHDLAPQHPELVREGLAILEAWREEALSRAWSPTDPLQEVLRQGGPYHIRAHVLPRMEEYLERLRATGRAHHAEALARRLR
jgi:choline-sulfatase